MPVMVNNKDGCKADRVEIPVLRCMWQKLLNFLGDVNPICFRAIAYNAAGVKNPVLPHGASSQEKAVLAIASPPFRVRPPLSRAGHAGFFPVHRLSRRTSNRIMALDRHTITKPRKETISCFSCKFRVFVVKGVSNRWFSLHPRR